MKFHRFNFLSLAVLSVALTLTCVKYKPYDNTFRHIDLILENTIKEQTEISLFELKTIDFENFKTVNTIREFQMCKDQENGLTQNQGEKINYCEMQIQYLYSKLGDNVKRAVEDNLKNIPELEFIYNIGIGKEFSLEEFSNKNECVVDIRQRLNHSSSICDKTYKASSSDAHLRQSQGIASVGLLSFGISEALLTSITATAGTASASAWIPFVGWAIAALAIVALIIIIAANWHLIVGAINEIFAFLAQKFTNISSLLNNAKNQSQIEAVNNFVHTVTVSGKECGLSSNISENDVGDALNTAVKVGGKTVGISALLGMLASNRQCVCLGVWNNISSECKYFLKTLTNSGVCFYCTDDEWTNLQKLYGDNLWPINVAFLRTMIDYDCYFLLCDNPNNYYCYSGIYETRIQERTYTDELQFIHTGRTTSKTNPTNNVVLKHYYEWSASGDYTIADY